jgi:hypothetical protein
MDELRKNIHISDYQGETFPYDPSKVKTLANVYKPEGLLDRLDPDDDFSSAKEIYQAYENVTPLLASMPDLWVYLAHVDLFPYVQKRWPKIFDENVDEQYVLNHWHENSHFMRTTFAGLWWHTYLSYDKSRENPFELTEVLFKSQDFRTLRFGELGLIRHRPAMMGVLEFLITNQDIMQTAFDARGEYISRYFNMLGGTKQLSYMDKDYFIDKLYDIKPRLEQITSIKDVQNKAIII